jgi:hypothetical protein
MPAEARLTFPEGRRFAFTIIDDTDVATRRNVEPVYAALKAAGLRTTKTVWAFDWPGHSNFAGSTTLEDADYVAFVQSLARDGFEIASHGASMETSDRATTQRALTRFLEVFGSVPRVFANHSNNAENLYWGTARVDEPILRALYRRVLGKSDTFFQGHTPDSPLFWGDLCHQHHEYVRNLTFDDLNVRRYNPTLPYRDPRRPYGRWWYSAADAEDRDEFVRVMTPQNLDALEREGGVCILATHFGKGYAPDGTLDPAVAAIIKDLGNRPGWYVPVGELLDWLRSRSPAPDALPAPEWRRMQWAWARALVRRRLQAGRLPWRQ